MYLAKSCFSPFYEVLEAACNLQKHAAQCKVGMAGCRPPVTRHTGGKLLAL